MDFTEVLRMVDAEVNRLRQLREIVAGLGSGDHHLEDEIAEFVAEANAPKAAAEPRLTIVPPRVKRSYGRRVKAASAPANALSGAVPSGPVVVHRAVANAESAAPVAAEKSVEAPSTPLDLESLMRQRLLA